MICSLQIENHPVFSKPVPDSSLQLIRIHNTGILQKHWPQVTGNCFSFKNISGQRMNLFIVRCLVLVVLSGTSSAIAFWSSPPHHLFCLSAECSHFRPLQDSLGMRLGSRDWDVGEWRRWRQFLWIKLRWGLSSTVTPTLCWITGVTRVQTSTCGLVRW